MLLTADAILSAEDRSYEDVEVPEWGGTVRVIGLSGTDRDAWEATMVDAKGQAATVRLQNFRAKLVAKCLVDTNGKRIFTDSQVKDLGQKNGSVLDRLFDKARELSGMMKDAVSDAEGNSESARNGSSISG
ncbi:hypothetical protein ACIQFP_10560 [Nocardiopsis alba]|uniref:hypothetical protein n=1 Tax=Nocardiopsis alba TaxID=53437 RepID=UPI0038184A3B